MHACPSKEVAHMSESLFSWSIMYPFQVCLPWTQFGALPADFSLHYLCSVFILVLLIHIDKWIQRILLSNAIMMTSFVQAGAERDQANKVIAGGVYFVQ